MKSQLSAANVQDALRKGRSITGLNVRWTEQAEFPNRAPTVLVLFAFTSDLSESSSELERYARYDPDWQRDPVLKAICIVGRGYWYHRTGQNAWAFHSRSPDHDEVIDLVSGIVNTLVKTPPFNRVTPLGHYLSLERAVVLDPGPMPNEPLQPTSGAGTSE